MSTFEFINPVVPGQNYPQPMQMQTGFANKPQLYPAYQQPNYPMNMQQSMQQQYQPMQPMSNEKFSYGFTVLRDETPDLDPRMSLPSYDNIPIPEQKERKKRKKKETSTDVVKVEDAEVVEESAAYTYSQTTNMLKETIMQIDMVAGEIKEELDSIKCSKTYRNRANALVGLSTSLGKLLDSKVSAISQINNSISKANDLDYKREKDRKTLEANTVADDAAIMNMYNAFISNPYGAGAGVNILGPNPAQAITLGSDIQRSEIITANGANNTVADASYYDYINNMTPEQNLMLYEGNPNVKTVVVYDAATGNRNFAVMDITTGQNIPNVPVMDDRFLDDTHIDLKTRIAKNNNLHESYPVIVINENIVNEY